jgi:hypothetical protein
MYLCKKIYEPAYGLLGPDRGQREQNDDNWQAHIEQKPDIGGHMYAGLTDDGAVDAEHGYGQDAERRLHIDEGGDGHDGAVAGGYAVLAEVIDLEGLPADAGGRDVVEVPAQERDLVHGLETHPAAQLLHHHRVFGYFGGYGGGEAGGRGDEITPAHTEGKKVLGIAAFMVFRGGRPYYYGGVDKQ